MSNIKSIKERMDRNQAISILEEMKAGKQQRTGGEKQYLQYGLTGARGEAASGFQSVQNIALPALEKALAEGHSLTEAGLCALLQLMAHVQDSNIIRRAGMEGQRFVTQQAQKWLNTGFDKEALRVMNEQFVERNLSPGGSADLLAAAYFLHFYLSTQDHVSEKPFWDIVKTNPSTNEGS